MSSISRIDGRHKPMNIQLQNYLITLWLSIRYDFVENIDIDEKLTLPENWEDIKNIGMEYV